MDGMIRIPVEDVEEAYNENIGYCISCGESHHGIEPDAEKYECESCGKETVFGAGSLLERGFVE